MRVHTERGGEPAGNGEDRGSGWLMEGSFINVFCLFAHNGYRVRQAYQMYAEKELLV
jgi:hypothetical protein